MSATGYVVVRSDNGRFMDSTGLWRREWPDANVFPSINDAKSSVRKTWRGPCMIYGVDNYGDGNPPVAHMDAGRVCPTPGPGSTHTGADREV